MVFSSMVFLGIFLPIVALVYYLLPRGFRNLWLFVASLVFYAWGEPRYVLIMLFSTVFDYANGRLIGYFDSRGSSDRWRKAVVAFSCVGNLGILFFFKYTDLVIRSIDQISGVGLSALGLALPIGISFYTFHHVLYH